MRADADNNHSGGTLGATDQTAPTSAGDKSSGFPQGSSGAGKTEQQASRVRQPRRRLSTVQKAQRAVWVAEMWSVWPMFILSVVFAFLSTAYLVARSDMTGAEASTVASVVVVIWIVFIVGYVVRLLASENKARFIKANWVELLTVIFPFFRPLLILVYIWRLPVTKATEDKFFRARLQITVAFIAVVFLYFIATAVWLVERNAPHANIRNWGDSMWWGVSTLSTVGYGDFVPVTMMGRLLATALMAGGIVIVGVVSASVISAFSDELKAMARRKTRETQENWARAEQIAPKLHAPRWLHRLYGTHHHGTHSSSSGQDLNEGHGDSLGDENGQGSHQGDDNT